MKSTLDCNTVKGQIYIGTQLSCHEIIERELKCSIIRTNSEREADIDALMYKDQTLISLAEIKSREMSLSSSGKGLMYKGREYDSYLITFEKLEKLSTLCRMLCVPGFLFVYLLNDKNVVVWKICDDNGRYTVELNQRRTRTQATCNGGVAFRENAYIPTSKMLILSKKS